MISSCLSLLAIYYYLKQDASLHTKALRAIALETSVIFTDTVLWFGLMALIAALTFYRSKAKSFYEYTLATLVALLLKNAGMVTTLALYLYDVALLGNKQTQLLRGAIILMNIGVGLWLMIDALQRGTGNGSTWAEDFVDTPCYAQEFWPLHDLYPACWLEVVIFLLPQVMISGEYWGVKLLIACCMTSILLSFVALWYDLGLIFKIKARAKVDFGDSYDDDAIGYGQIIATGLALQALTNYLWKVVCT